MAEMDRVRFVAGDESEEADVLVYQGFDAAQDTMAGQVIYITAETARLMAAFEVEVFKDDEWNRLHNPPDGFWDILAFGGVNGGARLAPDGVTPVYPLDWYTSTIVQRFNPDAGRTYDKVDAQGVKIGEGHFGLWENVEPVVGKPVPVGFVINEADWKDGRGDTPPFARYSDDLKDVEEKVHVAFITVEYSDGNEFKMEFSPIEHQSGTTYNSGPFPEKSAQLEEAINEAILNLKLYPEAAGIKV